MSHSLYVGNFPYSTTDEQLTELFSEYGSVESVRILKDRETGMSRGFGFVDMDSQEAAETVIAELNGMDFNGRPLKINHSRPRESRPERY